MMTRSQGIRRRSYQHCHRQVETQQWSVWTSRTATYTPTITPAHAPSSPATYKLVQVGAHRGLEVLNTAEAVSSYVSEQS
jgi:hypothetical protein